MLIKAVKKGATIFAIPVIYKKHKSKRKSGVNMHLILNYINYQIIYYYIINIISAAD